MATFHIYREDQVGKVTFRLEGTVDRETAKQLHQVLNNLGTNEVVLDFSHVREFFDLALPQVIRAIAEKKVQLRGIGIHQERILRYFGLGEVLPEHSVQAWYQPEAILQADLR